MQVHHDEHATTDGATGHSSHGTTASMPTTRTPGTAWRCSETASGSASRSACRSWSVARCSRTCSATRRPRCPADRWIPLVLGTAVFVYGGSPFLTGRSRTSSAPGSRA